MNKYAFIATLLLSFFMGCKQESLEPDQKADTNKFIAHDRTAISREEARAWFLSQYGVKKHVLREDPSGNLEFDIKPVWALSSTGIYGTSTPILVVPVQDIPSLNLGNRSAYFLLFYKDSLSVIQPALVYCVGDDTYADGTKPKSFADFSGFLIKMDLNGVFQQRVSFIQDGQNIFDLLPNPNPDSTGTIVWCYEDFFLEGSFGGAGGSALPNKWFDPAYMYWIIGNHHGTLVITAPPPHTYFDFYATF